jgi:hypothetical protein
VVSCELPFPSTNQEEQLNIAVEKQEMEAGEEGSQQSVHHPGGICQMHSLSPAHVASLIVSFSFCILLYRDFSFYHCFVCFWVSDSRPSVNWSGPGKPAPTSVPSHF